MSEEENYNYLVESIKSSNQSVIKSIESLKNSVNFDELLSINKQILNQFIYLRAYSDNSRIQQKLDIIKESNDKVHTNINELRNSIHNDFIDLSKSIINAIDRSKPLIEDKSNGLIISYPTRGIATIPSGTTKFDFRHGIATYPNNTEYFMSNSSKLSDSIYIKSFAVFVDRPVDLALYGKTSSTFSIPSGMFRLKDVELTRIEVIVDGDTNIWLGGSTLSDGAPNISFSFGGTDYIGMPNTITVGSKTDITTTSAQITTTSTPIYKVVVIKVRSLGTGTYIAIGNSSSQTFRLTAVKDSLDIDWIDNLNKVYVITDAGSTGSIEWIGG